jgi:ethanolamine utilization microcompartment shell protein EutL
MELRSYVLIDSMQPQYAALTGKVFTGSVAVEGMAQAFIEVAPACDIYELVDVALKTAEVRPGRLSVERVYGSLEIHSVHLESVKVAGAAALRLMGLTENDRQKPQVVSAKLVTRIDPYEAQNINQRARGGLLLAGQTLCVIEVTPAAYVVLAANEAEKAANITLIDYRDTGAFGRLYIGGTESEAMIARDAAVRAIEELPGRSPGTSGA